MVCIDSAPQRAMVKSALDGLGYTVHIPLKPEDAVQRIRANRYKLVIIHEGYGGSAESNLVLQTIQQLTMPLRRHMGVGLGGDQFRTVDNLMAFANTVNSEITDRELSTTKGIGRHALADNAQCY